MRDPEFAAEIAAFEPEYQRMRSKSMDAIVKTRVKGETATLGMITSFNRTQDDSDLDLLMDFDDSVASLPYAERRSIKRDQCERGEVPTRHLPTPTMGWYSMYHFCNDALCKRCGPHLARQAKSGTELHLNRVGKKKIRRIVFEVGNQSYGYLRDRINRLLTRYGIKRRIYPHPNQIVVHMDGHVKFTSFNTTHDEWLTPSEIDWLGEIRGAQNRKQSGNLFPKAPKLVGDPGVEVFVERLAVERGTSREVLGRARAESMKAVEDVRLPSAEEVSELDCFSRDCAINQIQACYDLMTKKFKETIEESGASIVGNTSVRVCYIEKESVSKILVQDLAMREALSIKPLIPI